MVYTPKRGFAQFQYFDQQATALAGMLANASDINLVDSAFVGPVDATVGLTAGIGVMVKPTVCSNRPGLNYDIVMPPDSAATDESFAGIVVRNQFMRTNSNGEACYFFEDMANYARRDRAGARIWVQLAQGSTVFGGPVYWIVRDTKNAGLKIGAFSAAPITGTATPTPGSLNGGTLSVNDVKAVTNGGFEITVANTPHKVAALNFSSVNTVSDVATILQTAITTASVPVTVKAVGNGVVLTTTATGVSATINVRVCSYDCGYHDRYWRICHHHVRVCSYDCGYHGRFGYPWSHLRLRSRCYGGLGWRQRRHCASYRSAFPRDVHRRRSSLQQHRSR